MISDPIEETAKKIVSLLLENIRQAESTESSCKGSSCPMCQAPHLEQLKNTIHHGRSIQLILPAFPAKSANRQKTISPMPDLGEVLGLKNLNRICEDIAGIYTPGAELIICSDGRVFNDLVLVSDDEVNLYQQGIRDIIDQHQLKYLKTYSLDNVYQDKTYSQMRDVLMEEYGESYQSLKQRLLVDESVKYQFNGIHRFIVEDQLAIKWDHSKNKIRIEAKDIAYDVVRRSNAWSRLLEDRFPGSVRLSIHPQPCGSSKLGIQFLPASNRWATPWHNVLLKKGEHWELIKRAEAERLGAWLNQDHYVLEPN